MNRLPSFRLVRHSVVLFIASLLSACSNDLPGGVLSERVMEKVLYDYHIAQAMAEGEDSADIRRYEYVQAVFRKHHITEAQFDSSMVWYSSHASHLHDIYRRLSERYDTEARVLGIGVGPKDQYAGLTAVGDTANIWADRNFVLLKPDEGSNRMQFVLEADTTFRPGDAFMWRFTPCFIYREGMREAYVVLSVRLSNDSVVSSLHRLMGDYKVELSVRPQGDWSIKEVSGFVYVPATDVKSPYRLVVLSDFALIRFHKVRKPTADTFRTPADSLQHDSLSGTMPATPGSVRPIPERRLSPRELREETQPAERTIDVVKSKPYRRVPNQTVTRRSLR